MEYCHYINVGLRVIIAVVFFLFPAGTVIQNTNSRDLHEANIPKTAWRLFQQLTPEYEKWAEKRLHSSRAANLSTEDIAGTEWPLFGSVFYLWSVESLQEQWENNPALASVPPNVSARKAINAATQLVIDPSQAHWVKMHWGTNYLSNQNAFYRMLYISAITSHAKLTGDRQFLPQLKQQVDSLVTEIDNSRFGWLDDYPGECYPGDVMTAIHAIKKADAVLGTDHSVFIRKAIRGFTGQRVGPLELVPYAASLQSGHPLDISRGCGNSYVSLNAPFLWPEQAQKWYSSFTQHFWQEKWTAVGFREFAKATPHPEWYMDVDSGPVLAGFGFSACAFGVGAARVNGHMEHAYPLTSEMLCASWPLWNGTLLTPRLLSDATDAPFLGEAAILYNLTRTPAPGVTITKGGTIPMLVHLVCGIQIAIGFLLLWASYRSISKWRKFHHLFCICHVRFQGFVWLGLMGTGVVLWFTHQIGLALICILMAQFFPHISRKNDTNDHTFPPSQSEAA
jgi:hypothetical protein